MKNKRISFRLIGYAFTLVLLAAGAWLTLNRQQVLDWYVLRSFRPNSGLENIVSKTAMTNHGKDLFYASRPIVQSAQEFNKNCTNASEQSLILGCYKFQKIYLFDITDQRLEGVEEVTAAHEMLHAAYERLSNNERTRVNKLIEAQLKIVTNPRILSLVTLYNKQEPGQLNNEMHSILATEYADLLPDLELYFKQYFSERSKTVAMSNGYEAVFEASKQKIVQQDAELATLKTQIDDLNTKLEAKQADLAVESAQLSTLKAQNLTNQYNQLVPSYNNAVGSFNQQVAEAKELVARYNDLVSARNAEAAAQNNLYQNMDSRYQTVPQT